MLSFRNADLDFLKGCRKELERCDNNAEYTEEEIKQIEERCSYLKNLDLEEKYIETQKSIKTPDENIENLEKSYLYKKMSLQVQKTIMKVCKLLSKPWRKLRTS